MFGWLLRARQATIAALQRAERVASNRVRHANARTLPVVLLACWFTLVVPVIVDLAVSGPKRPFGYVAADAFYYLVVGRNIGHAGAFSYDGTNPTNGYHPLWQLLVGLLYALHLPGIDTQRALVYVVALNLVFLCAALWLLARLLRRPDGSLSLLFIGLPFGAYAAMLVPHYAGYSGAEFAGQNLIEGSEPLYGTLWSYANGMESSLTVLMYALALTVVSVPVRRTSAKQACVTGLTVGVTLAGLTLARLDHVFFAIALGALAMFRFRPLKGHWWYAAATLAAGFIVPLGLYLVINYGLVGAALPVSGRLKTTAPQFTDETFKSIVGLWAAWVDGKPMRPVFIVWRVAQVVLPVLVACISPWVLLRWRCRRGGLQLCPSRQHIRVIAPLCASGAGVLMLAAYNFLFVFAQGNWYYPVSTLYVSLVALVGLDRLLLRLSSVRWISARRSLTPLPLRYALRWTSVLAVMSVSVVGFARFHRKPDYHNRYADFYFEEVPRIHAAFGKHAPKLLEFDDGIAAWATGYPTMSATGFVLDPEAADALRERRLVPLALKRGFNCATSVVYVNYQNAGATVGAPPNPQWHDLEGRIGSFNGLSPILAYRSDRINFAIICLAKT